MAFAAAVLYSTTAVAIGNHIFGQPFDLSHHVRAKGGAAEHDPSQRVVEGGGRRHLKHRVAVVRAPSVADIPAQRLASADDDTSLLLELDFGQSLMHTSKIKMMTLCANAVSVVYSRA